MIGFYVHHHGRGHLARAAAIIDELNTPAVVFSSLPSVTDELEPGTTVVELPLDVDEGTAPRDPTGRGALHWAPLSSSSLGERSALLADWFAKPELALLVCDVSVETAVLARLCGVPPVVVRSHGDRSDRAHRLGFDVAAAVIAPFPAALEHHATPPSLRRRTTYCGFINRALGRSGSEVDERIRQRSDFRRRHQIPADSPILLLAVGAGGHSLDEARLHEMCDALPGWTVVTAGIDAFAEAHPSLRQLGWVEDLHPCLKAADVVAGHGGANLVAEVAAADRPFICVPEARPFAEQHHRAEQLERLGAAVVVPGWAPTSQWPAAIEAALALGSNRLHQLAEPGGARRCADLLTQLHEKYVP